MQRGVSLLEFLSAILLYNLLTFAGQLTVVGICSCAGVGDSLRSRGRIRKILQPRAALVGKTKQIFGHSVSVHTRLKVILFDFAEILCKPSLSGGQ